MDRQPSLVRRLMGGVLRALVPGVMTLLAALLGYAFAVYPIRHDVRQQEKMETLGGFIPALDARRGALGAYYPDCGLDAKALDGVLWAVRTVMTPFVGHAPAPGQQHNGYIDAHQFRGKRELQMPKPPGLTRIFLTGASVAFSAGAPSDERTIAGYLQTLLDARSAETGARYEIFTFATPAWSSTQERIAIENRLSELEPDLVISLTGVADAFYGERGRNILWARALTDQYYWDLVNIALTRSGSEPMVDVEDVSPDPVAPEIVAARLQKNVILAAKALAMSNARYHVFLQPSITTTRKRLSPREKGLRFARTGYFTSAEYHQRSYGEIDSRLTSGGMPSNTAYTNLSGMFDEIPEEQDIFLDSFHFGDRGNYLIAKEIGAALQRAGSGAP
jgi:hypothetical protein